jgi:HlyD family secretion protein
MDNTRQEQPMKNLSTTQPDKAGYAGYLLLGTATIAIAFGGFVGWAAIAPISSAAVASGRVEVETATKPVQHLEGGLLSEILVKEGDRIKKGDVLFRLQPTKAEANLQAIQFQLDAATAKQARLLCEKSDCAAIVFPKSLRDRAGKPDIATIIADQSRQWRERRQMLRERISMVTSQLHETTALSNSSKARAAALKIELDSLDQEIKRLNPVVERGNYPRNKFAAVKRNRARVAGNLAATLAEIERYTNTAKGKRISVSSLRQQQREEVSGMLAETHMEIAKAKAQIRIAADTADRVAVRAAKDGIIQNIKVSMRGEVVAPGSQLAEIVPVGDTLVIGAKVSPADIDSISPGHTAQLRVRSFSASKTPPINGTVKNISADTLIDEATGNAYYKAQVTILKAEVAGSLLERLVPGMPVDVIIAKEDRTVLQYLVDPLIHAFAKSMRER